VRKKGKESEDALFFSAEGKRERALALISETEKRQRCEWRKKGRRFKEKEEKGGNSRSSQIGEGKTYSKGKRGA